MITKEEYAKFREIEDRMWALGLEVIKRLGDGSLHIEDIDYLTGGISFILYRPGCCYDTHNERFGSIFIPVDTLDKDDPIGIALKIRGERLAAESKRKAEQLAADRAARDADRLDRERVEYERLKLKFGS